MMMNIRTILIVFLITAAAPSFSDIQKTQTYLSDLGYNAGTIDGLWGKKTEQALVQFLSDQSQVWDGKFDEVEFKFLEKVWISENANSLISINKTTSRYIRARNNCDAAKSIDKVDKEAFGRDLSDHLFAFVDLNQDKKLDLIQGFEEEPYNTANIRAPVDYKVFMSNGETFSEKLPNLIARKILVQDFNNDGRDDVVFLNTGPHKPPRPGLTNRILLSEPNGYLFRELPGGSRISHGGAAGDLDRDGDVDIIVANGQQQDVQILINLGDGKFRSKTLYSQFAAHPYTAEVWDVDSDGWLDIVFGVPAKGIFISYGRPSKSNNPKFSKPRQYSFDILKDRLPLDFAFSVGDLRPKLGLVIIDSRLGPNSYRGWGINDLQINQDRSAKITRIYDFDPGDNYHWNAWIDICDLDGDGKSELVSNKLGRDNMWALDNPQQIVWTLESSWVQKAYPRGKPVNHLGSSRAKQKVKKITTPVAVIEDPDWPISKRPDGTVKSKTVCHYAMDENGFIESRKMWVDEAKRRNLDKAICDFFKSQ